MDIYSVVESHDYDIYGEQSIHGYFSTRDKAEDYILKHNLLDRETKTCSVYVQTIKVDEE